MLTGENSRPAKPDRASAAQSAGSTERAGVDAEAVRAVIRRAKRTLASSGRPDLGPLERELRGHVQALLPLAEAVVGRMWPSSLEWWLRRSRLDAVRHLLDEAPGCDPLTAHIQVHHLVSDCAAMLGYIEEGQR